jgi:glycosyltransferase involved in cell wall biosynthesis
MKILSIVIASLDRHIDLHNCLQSIGAVFDVWELKLIEVIIIDQSSKTFSANKDLTFPIKILKSKKGASLARNLGAKAASGRLLWFLDDDARVTSFDLKSLLSPSSNVFFIKWEEKPFRPHKFHLLNKLNIVRKSGTPFFIVDKKIFFEVGMFNVKIGPGTTMSGGEDLDFLLRVNSFRKIGKIIEIGSVSHAVHDLKDVKLKYYAMARGKILLRNREYFLLFCEIIFSVYQFLLGNKSRLIHLITGLYNEFTKN